MFHKSISNDQIIREDHEDAIIQCKHPEIMNHLVYNLLCVGDRLIAVNEINVEKVSYLKKLEMIKQMNRPIILDFMTGIN